MDDPPVVCVIGAGFFGLIAARRFLELCPTARLTIFEADSHLGGVWNRDRVYDELLTESSLGMYEYSDEPMIAGRVHGKDVSAYLENYARQYDLYQRIRFNTRVTNFVKVEKMSQWQLELENREEVIGCDKLVVATGLTSTPSIPIVPAAQEFSTPQHHVRSLAKIQISSSDQHIIVVGGAKSAYDAAFTMAKQGARRVTLVVKESSPGPAWLLPQHLCFGIDADKVVGTRLISAFNPNIWSCDTWLHSLLHKTSVGQWIVKHSWQLAEELVKWQIGYQKNKNLSNLLPPNGSLFWSSTNTCVLNHSDFVDMVRHGRIEVKRSAVEELTNVKTVRFADGTESEVDLIIWATGWKSTLSSLRFEQKSEVHQRAEAYMLNQCPLLRERSTGTPSPSLPLYRRLVPIDYIHDHSIVYVGMLQSPGTGVVAEAQAVWSAIYLMGGLEINGDAQWDIAVTNAWLNRRYAMVERHSNYTHDFIQYADLLLVDLQLNCCRKKCWWREMFEAYMPRDYRGLLSEWTASRSIQ